jgi:hypothetical protein
MTEFETNRRCGEERRKFNYTRYVPERRSGKERRIAKNGQINQVKESDKIWFMESNFLYSYCKIPISIYLQ